MTMSVDTPRSTVRGSLPAADPFFPRVLEMKLAWRFPRLALACAIAAGGCAVDPEDLMPPVVPVGPPMTGLHVVGNHIENADGATVILSGVNRSGTEYRCIQGGGLFDGPTTSATVTAMASWKLNAVRIPLNESCWLGINGAPDIYSGVYYKDAIRAYVDLLHKF